MRGLNPSKERTQSSPNPHDSKGNITATAAQLSERRFHPGAVRPRGYARPSRLRPPRVDYCQPTALRLDPPNTPAASFAQSLLSVIQGREGYAAGAALFVFGERSLTHSHTLSCDYHVLQKCDKAQQLRTVAPPPLGSFAFSLPTLELFSGFAPPTFNPFKDLPVDSPVQTREQGAHYSSSNVGCGALNTNAFADMIKSYKLHNEPFISISRVPNERCRSSFPGSSPLWSRSFGLLLPTNLTLSPVLSSVPTLRLFFSPSPTFLICLMLCS